MAADDTPGWLLEAEEILWDRSEHAHAAVPEQGIVALPRARANSSSASSAGESSRLVHSPSPCEAQREARPRVRGMAGTATLSTNDLRHRLRRARGELVAGVEANNQEGAETRCRLASNCKSVAGASACLTSTGTASQQQATKGFQRDGPRNPYHASHQLDGPQWKCGQDQDDAETFVSLRTRTRSGKLYSERSSSMAAGRSHKAPPERSQSASTPSAFTCSRHSCRGSDPTARASKGEVRLSEEGARAGKGAAPRIRSKVMVVP